MRPLALTLGCIATLSLTGCNGTQMKAPLNAIAQSQVELKVGGSSSSHAAVEALSEVYRNQAPDIKLTIMPKGQSESAIAGVKGGLINVAAISRRDLNPNRIT